MQAAPAGIADMARRWPRLFCVLALVLSLGACAAQNAGSGIRTPGDPIEPLNRNVLDFNMAIDDAAIKPVALGYRKVVPEYGRDRIRSFLGNLQEPRILANNLLQFRLLDAGTTLARFLVNSTVGLAGLYDVASIWGMDRRSGDLGQTLYVWGVGDGPYLMLPVIGPSNTRDTVGWVGDGFLNPINWLLPVDVTIARGVVDGIDIREQNIEGLEELRRGSLDFYARLRSVWQQRRNAELGRTGASGEQLDILDDPGAADEPIDVLDDPGASDEPVKVLDDPGPPSS
jgi:phospholipid-binding lipoprotein MlaA